MFKQSDSVLSIGWSSGIYSRRKSPGVCIFLSLPQIVVDTMYGTSNRSEELSSSIGAQDTRKSSEASHALAISQETYSMKGPRFDGSTATHYQPYRFSFEDFAAFIDMCSNSKLHNQERGEAHYKLQQAWDTM